MGYDKNLDDELTKLVVEHKSSYSSMIWTSAKLEHLKSYVLQSTESMSDLPICAKIYMTLSNQTDYVKCKVCGNDLPHDRRCDPISGYLSLCCSRSCAQKDPDYREKRKTLSQARYGVDHPQQSKSAVEKIKSTIAKRSAEEKASISEKRKSTCLKKYGVEYVSQTAEHKLKSSMTQLAHSDARREEIRKKTNATMLERHGCLCNAEKISETKRAFSDEKNAEINAKREKTCIERYGVKSVVQVEEIAERKRKAATETKRGKTYDNIFSRLETVRPLFTREQYVNDPHQELRWVCNTCGTEFSTNVGERCDATPRCYSCFPLNSHESSVEKDIVEFIQTMYDGPIIRNDRTTIAPKEVDILLPDKKIAVEYDGIYWHSENMGTKSDYHLSKTDECEKKGFQLIHIFENEWINHQPIVKSRLRAALGSYDETIYARKCVVKNVPKCEAEEFLRTNHLQGSCVDRLRYGLYYKDGLIALMTFGKPRFSNAAEWELLRFCTKLNLHVVGGASKLLKHFERETAPKSLLSYADRKWSRGRLYEALGFKLSHVSRPNYFYVKWSANSEEVLPRQACQKHKLKKILSHFDEDLSEYENMSINGYVKIYDSGNLVYIKDYT